MSTESAESLSLDPKAAKQAEKEAAREAKAAAKAAAKQAKAEAKEAERAEKEAAKEAAKGAKEAERAAKSVATDAAALAKTFRPNPHVNIIVDSCGDFDPAIARALGVTMIGFPYVLNGEEHIDDLFQTVSAHEFYEGMRHGDYPTTSAVTPGRYHEVFEEAAKKGVPSIYLGFTRALSSSIDSARTAAEMIRQEYPDFELYVVDNKCPSAATQLLVMEAVHQANLGATAKDLATWAEEARYFVHGYFTLDSFDALARGGRIPAAAASLGGKLDIKPELSYDESGALSLTRMCRGRKKALRAIIEDFREKSAGERSMPVGIMTADAEKDGDWLEGLLRKEPGCEDIPVIRSSISPVIGSHVGPGMVAMVFWGSDRREDQGLSGRIASKVGLRRK